MSLWSLDTSGNAANLIAPNNWNQHLLPENVDCGSGYFAGELAGDNHRCVVGGKASAKNRPWLSPLVSPLGFKTLYQLNYIDQEACRRRILTQLNRGEGRNGMARATFHGQRGEIRKRYREGQEDQLGALGLVVNTMVLWNTIYMHQALEHIRADGGPASGDDAARLSPLEHGHFNFLGTYSFLLTDEVRDGQLRPLRSPDEIEEMVA